VRTYAPPPPPPPAPLPPPPPAVIARPRHQVVKHRHVAPKHRRAVARPKASKLRPSVRPRTPDAPLRRSRLTSAAVVSAGTAGSSRLPASLKLLLAVALGLLLLLVGAALAPARAVPQAVFARLDERRELVFSAAMALGLGIAVGLVVVAST
jgi:hypothetical protein